MNKLLTFITGDKSTNITGKLWLAFIRNMTAINMFLQVLFGSGAKLASPTWKFRFCQIAIQQFWFFMHMFQVY